MSEQILSDNRKTDRPGLRGPGFAMFGAVR
jgi:hypothetical protein